MLWLKTFTAGFIAVPAIAFTNDVAVLFAFRSMIDFSPVNWFRSSDDETSELFTGNVGSNGISLLQKKIGRQVDPLRVVMQTTIATTARKIVQGTTLVAGSLHGP